jgi:hypothetical protein
MKHCLNYICIVCHSMFAYKIRCPYCGGKTEGIRPLQEIPELRPVEKRCVKWLVGSFVRNKKR